MLAVFCRLSGLHCTRELSAIKQTTEVFSLSHRFTSLRKTHVLSSNYLISGTSTHSKSIVCYNGLYNKYFMQPCRQKGHSKWQNIRHIKASNDGKMRILTETLLRAVSVAIKETGETNPDFNPRLRHVLDSAQHHSVPKATLMKHIKTAAESAKNAKMFQIECRGPFGSAMIIEAMAAKQAKTKNELQGLLKKYGATLHNISSVKLVFDHKGMIDACVPDGQEPISQDKVEEIAIEAGAEEVEISGHEVGTKTVYEFICDPKDFGAVRKSIEEQGLHIIGSYLGYIPNTYVDIPKDAVDTISEFIEKLEAVEEVVRVFDNFKLPS